MPKPDISVIVPVYNGAAFLGDTLRSLLAQSFGNFELLVIDDGSQDGSWEIAKSMGDNRIRVIRQKNEGLCHTLNRGLSEAVAPFVARNDQDDLSAPHRLERQLAVLRGQPDALAVYSNYTKFGAKRAWSNADKQTADGSVTEIAPLRDGCTLGSSLFARTDALRSVGGYRQECYPCDDYDLEMRLTEHGKVLLLHEASVSYRFHVGANTYSLFTLMQDKTRWVEDSYRRRRRGESEQTLDEFLSSRRLTRSERSKERRFDKAKLHMRVAGQRYLDGRDFAAGWHFALSAFFDPHDPLARAKRLLLNRRRSPK
jgi:glycosyltransferase involved in cell wall biosynthesis